LFKRRWIPIIAVALTLAVGFTAILEFWVLPSTNTNQNKHILFQISPFNTFSTGNFAGNTTYAELAKHGDFGIGTLNGLNGEMIALDGIFYQIPSTGNPRQIGSEEKTPYATITFFKPDQTNQVTETLNFSQLTAGINMTLPNYNAIYAIKIQGEFEYAKTRSPPLQPTPYPNLTQALTNQSVFTLNNVVGTAVGFYFPSSMDGVDYPGYHLHFITNDKTAGGHLLDCIVRNITIEIGQINNYELKLP
jgi:acetolactate decarboxylase